MTKTEIARVQRQIKAYDRLNREIIEREGEPLYYLNKDDFKLQINIKGINIGIISCFQFGGVYALFDEKNSTCLYRVFNIDCKDVIKNLQINDVKTVEFDINFNLETIYLNIN